MHNDKHHCPSWSIRCLIIPALSLLSLAIVSGLIASSITASTPTAEEPAIRYTHGISRYGEPALPPNTGFPYVNSKAPKGGVLRQPMLGNFDTFNGYGPQGKAPQGHHYIHDTLLIRGWDEPLTKYGILTKTIEQPEDNSWIAFHLDPKARFHDGKPITAHDVVFSFKTLTEQGNLFWRQFYQDVANVTATSDHRVLFTFKHNRHQELPLILGQLPILASHWWRDRDFSQSTLEIPVGSGPYRIKRFKPGHFIEYERVPDYWAANHPLNRGRFNFDILRFDIFRDNNVILEAMNSGLLDLRFETDARYWRSAYSQKALTAGKLIKAQWQNNNPSVYSLVINSRRPLLQDIRVREAIATLLEIDPVLTNLFDGMMVRANSLFAGTELAAASLPSPDERTLLEQTAKELEDTTALTRPLTQSWPPLQNKSKRERLKHALLLLQQAGLKLRNGTLTTASGQPVVFELLLSNPSLERLLQSQVRRFAEADIKLNLRTVDSASYIKSLRSLDFDLTVHTFNHTPSPGTEQRSFWGSTDAHQPGTRNLAGLENPAIDQLLEQLNLAESRAELVTTVNAIDRLILWQFKVIPLAYQPNWMIVHSNRITAPRIVPRYIMDRTTLWATPSAPGQASTLGQSDQDKENIAK